MKKVVVLLVITSMVFSSGISVSAKSNETVSKQSQEEFTKLGVNNLVINTNNDQYKEISLSKLLDKDMEIDNNFLYDDYYTTDTKQDINVSKYVYDTTVSVSENYETLINQYYDLVNQGKHDEVVNIYGESLKNYVSAFFNNKNNRKSHEGIYNVINGEVLYVDSMSQMDTYVYDDYTYSNAQAYFVKCNMNVYISDKYYTEGTNYFIFYIGEDINGDIRIINIEIPYNRTIRECDADSEDVELYVAKRKSYLYGGISLYLTDVPTYIDAVKNPSKIRVLYNGNVVEKNFTDYLKVVASNEMNTISNIDGARACAMAIKMFAMHFVNTAASGSNYDINATTQVYKEGVTISTSAKNAVDYITNYFLLDYYGANFKTFYRTRESNNAYCKKNGGILAQIESNSKGIAGSSWQDIVRHYYTRIQSVSYYNPHMNYGDLIITSAHTHDWGSGSTCTYCGAIAK